MDDPLLKIVSTTYLLIFKAYSIISGGIFLVFTSITVTGVLEVFTFCCWDCNSVGSKVGIFEGFG